MYLKSIRGTSEAHSGNYTIKTSPNLLSHKSNENVSKNIKIDFSRTLEIT